MADEAAGGGLLHRRTLLQLGVAGAGVAAAGSANAAQRRASAPKTPPPPPDPMKVPGTPTTGYGSPSHWRADVKRTFAISPTAPGTGGSRTPLQALEGAITPSGLHFERHHNGVPDIDPARHQLLIHGLVRQPLVFTLENLMRYPLTSRVRFIECAGNSGVFNRPEPVQDTAGTLNGLIACSEWTGVKLSTLLDEAGLAPGAAWVIAEGGDAAGMSRSVPLSKCMDDAMVALYQNGEAIRPEQGFPMRLLLPGYQGNTNVKWLHRLKVTAGPAHTKDETSRYSELMPDGKARQFMLTMAVKSCITRPSFGLDLKGPGFYEISGLAWSGDGRITRVEVSADGGKSWADAALAEPVLSKAVVRFRAPWQWDGGPTVLMSRAYDETGAVQPRRADWLAQYAPGQGYHFNAVQAWAVGQDGKIANVYA
jgi:sulfane dehydrogenase subunit SoxC